MKLNDSVFINQLHRTTEQPKRLTNAEKHQLRGIGDRHLREAYGVTNFITGQDVPDWDAGDDVTYVTPDNITHKGNLVKQGKHGWYVRVDDGEIALVPENELRQSPKVVAEQVKEALFGERKLNHIHESRSPIVMGDDMKLALRYASYAKCPTNEEVLDYVADRYPGYRVLDADDSKPGLISVVVSKDAAYDRFTTDYSQGGPQQTGTEDRPGVVEEEIEGTGKIGEESDEIFNKMNNIAHNAMGKFEAANPGLVVVSSETEKTYGGDEKDAILKLGFSLQNDTHNPLFLEPNGELTPTLSENSYPARGFIQVKADGEKDIILVSPNGDVSPEQYGLKSAQVEAPYSQGAGPMGTREDYPGGYEDGAYVRRSEKEEDKKEDGSSDLPLFGD